MRVARNCLVLWISLIVCAPLAFSSQDEGDVRISEFTRDALAGPSPFLPHRSEGAGRALESLLGGKHLPISCASPLLMELWRHRDALSDSVHESLRVLSVRPSLPHDAVYQTRDGRFVIHYTLDASSPDSIQGTDSDLNGIPDRVDSVEMALARAVEVLSAGLSWPLPESGPREDAYDIYVVSLGPDLNGLTVLDREIASTPQDDAFSHILVDGRLEPPQLEAAVIHQFAHASLLALSTRAPAWWNEATAGWLEARVTGDPGSMGPALARRLERLDLSLATDSLLMSLGDSLWVSFLAERGNGDPDAIRGIWQEESSRGSVPFPSLLDQMLGRNGGEGLQGAYREFTRWALFTGKRDDGEHFRLGQLYPPLVPRATFEAYPADLPGSDSVEPLGAAIYRLAGDGSRGGMRVRLDAQEAASSLEMDLVITPSSGDRRPYLVELSPDGSGRAEAGIPWRNVAEAMVIVRNAAAGGKPIRYHLTAAPDPLFPFDISSFAALPSDGGVTLQWSTAHEKDLLGWNVYRSAAPAGPYLRINPVTLPSGGDSDEETDYLYQDDSAAEGQRYFYLVEGITVQGLADRSFSVSGLRSAPETLP
jgi:hypothetical protein